MAIAFLAQRLRCPVVIVVLLAVCGPALGQGVMLSGVGPVNRAMGGAATAAPIDAAGALRWNPATISGMASSEVTFGAELLLQTETIRSTVGVSSGTTEGEPGTGVIPEMALVHRQGDSRWTFGLGMLGIAGFKANYPASTTNPISLPQPVGLGRIFAEFEVFDVVPTVSYALTPHLAVGFSPTLSISRLSADPFFLTAPDDANGDMSPTYPHGLGGRYHYGGGATLGVYYIAGGGWHLGASIKSPTWFEEFRFFTEDEVGGPRLERLDLDLPTVISLGAAYDGIERWLWAVDLRYFGYKNANGFGGVAGFDDTGAGTGLGWSNIFSAVTGLQFQPHECLLLRLGYIYQHNPISSRNTFFNASSPLLISHILSVGFSYHLTNQVVFNLAYLHGFEGVSTGPIILPGVGPVPGSSVTSEVSADALGISFTVQY